MGTSRLWVSDPDIRPKFHGRRISIGRFLDEMHAATDRVGRISVMTDHEGLFQEMLEVSERDDRWEKAHRERYLVGYEAEGRSRYQRIWEGHGIPTLRFELVKGRPEKRG